MRLAFAVTRCAPRKRRMSWVTRLTVFFSASAACGWLLALIKHTTTL